MARVRIRCICSSFSSYPFLPTVSPATIAANAAAIAPLRAAILPPPGTGSLPATLARKSLTVESTNIVIFFFIFIIKLRDKELRSLSWYSHNSYLYNKVEYYNLLSRVLQNHPACQPRYCRFGLHDSMRQPHSG